MSTTVPTSQQIIFAIETLLKTFLGAFIGTILASGGAVLTMNGGDWKAAAGSGIAAVLVFAYNYLNPNDGRYGVSAISK